MKKHIEIKDLIVEGVQVHANRKFDGVWTKACEDLLSLALSQVVADENGHCSGWIYAVRDLTTGLIKVGLSFTPDARVYGFASRMGGGNFESYISSRRVSDARLWEALISAELARFHHDKEWFKCSLLEAVSAIEDNYTDESRILKLNEKLYTDKLLIIDSFGVKTINDASKLCGLSVSKLSILSRDERGRSYSIPNIAEAARQAAALLKEGEHEHVRDTDQ